MCLQAFKIKIGKEKKNSIVISIFPKLIPEHTLIQQSINEQKNEHDNNIICKVMKTKKENADAPEASSQETFAKRTRILQSFYVFSPNTTTKTITITVKSSE